MTKKDKQQGSPPTKATTSVAMATTHGPHIVRSPSKHPKPSAVAVTPYQKRAPNNIHVVGLKGGIILVKITAKDFTGGYFQPLKNYLTDPQYSHVCEKAKIHYVGYLVSPNDPKEHKLDPPRGSSGFRPKTNIFASVLPSDTFNTPENRKKFAQIVQEINNNASMQIHGYQADPTSNRNKIDFAGDLTPVNADMGHLSSYLTISDCMDLLSQIFKEEVTEIVTENGQPKEVTRQVPLTPHMLCQSTEHMETYFHPAHRQLAKTIYLTQEGQATGTSKNNLVGSIDISNLEW